MRVRVRVYATLRRYLPQAASGAMFETDLPEGATVASLLARLQLPETEVKVTFVNGRARPLDWPLAPGDEVGIFPPIGGG